MTWVQDYPKRRTSCSCGKHSLYTYILQVKIFPVTHVDSLQANQARLCLSWGLHIWTTSIAFWRPNAWPQLHSYEVCWWEQWRRCWNASLVCNCSVEIVTSTSFQLVEEERWVSASHLWPFASIYTLSTFLCSLAVHKFVVYSPWYWPAEFLCCF